MQNRQPSDSRTGYDKWVNQSSANKIVVVSDELAADEFMLQIYLLSAPAGVKVECYGIEDTIKHWNEDQFGAGKVLLLLPDLKSMKQVYDGGVTVPQIQGRRPGRRTEPQGCVPEYHTGRSGCGNPGVPEGQGS